MDDNAQNMYEQLEAAVENSVSRAEDDYDTAVRPFERTGKYVGGGLAGASILAGTLALAVEHPDIVEGQGLFNPPGGYGAGSGLASVIGASGGASAGESVGRRIGEAVTGAEAVEYDAEELYEGVTNHADAEGLLT